MRTKNQRQKQANRERKQREKKNLKRKLYEKFRNIKKEERRYLLSPKRGSQK